LLQHSTSRAHFTAVAVAGIESEMPGFCFQVLAEMGVEVTVVSLAQSFPSRE
jgi:hypothetical protein